MWPRAARNEIVPPHPAKPDAQFFFREPQFRIMPFLPKTANNTSIIWRFAIQQRVIPDCIKRNDGFRVFGAEIGQQTNETSKFRQPITNNLFELGAMLSHILKRFKDNLTVIAGGIFYGIVELVLP